MTNYRDGPPSKQWLGVVCKAMKTPLGPSKGCHPGVDFQVNFPGVVSGLHGSRSGYQFVRFAGNFTMPQASPQCADKPRTTLLQPLPWLLEIQIWTDGFNINPDCFTGQDSPQDNPFLGSLSPEEASLNLLRPRENYLCPGLYQGAFKNLQLGFLLIFKRWKLESDRLKR